MLRYSAQLLVSRQAQFVFFLPFLLLSLAAIWHTVSFFSLTFGLLILVAGLIMALRLRPKYQLIMFDDIGNVTLQGDEEYCGQMQSGCQIWPWLLAIKLNNEQQQAFTLLIYADAISSRGFRRLARVINLNRLSYQ